MVSAVGRLLLADGTVPRSHPWRCGLVDASSHYIQHTDQLSVVPYEALPVVPRMAFNYRKLRIKVNQTKERCQSKLPKLLP